MNLKKTFMKDQQGKWIIDEENGVNYVREMRAIYAKKPMDKFKRQ
jgi:hypothetical protein